MWGGGGKPKLMRVSEKPAPEQIIVDQKKLKNVECFNYLSSMTINVARCTHEIKSRIVMARASFNVKKPLSTSKLDLNLSKKLVKCCILA